MSATDTEDRTATTDRRWLVALVVAFVVVLAPSMWWGAPGGKSIVGAQRVLRGEVPYRDFWTMYAPGQFYLVAALFRTFGAHIFVQSAALICLIAAGGGTLFVILRRIGVARLAAAAVGAIYVALLWTARPCISSYEPAMLLVLLGIDRIVAYHREGVPRRLLLAGMLFGAAACFKHDVAAHAWIASCVSVVVASAVVGTRRPAEWVRPAGAVMRMAVGSALFIVPVAGLLASSAGADAWRDLFEFPAQTFPLVMRQPFPGLLPPGHPVRLWLRAPTDPRAVLEAVQGVGGWALCTWPQWVFLAAVVWLVRRRAVLEPWRFATGLTFATAIPLFWASAHVQQNTHPTSMGVFSLLLVGVAHASGAFGVRPHKVLRWGLAGVGVAYCAFVLTGPVKHVADIVLMARDGGVLDIPFARGVHVRSRMLAPYERFVGFIREHVPPDEPIYSGVVRHDAIVGSNQTFYYLAERPVAVRYNELHPGLADSPAVQREIIESLESKRVRCVILWRFGWSDALLDSIRDERRAAIPDLGATLLDEYLRREFEVIDTAGEYHLCWRRGIPPPTPWR